MRLYYIFLSRSYSYVDTSFDACEHAQRSKVSSIFHDYKVLTYVYKTPSYNIPSLNIILCYHLAMQKFLISDVFYM